MDPPPEVRVRELRLAFEPRGVSPQRGAREVRPRVAPRVPRHPRRLLLVPQVDPAEQVRETVVVNLTGMRDRGSLRDACVAWTTGGVRRARPSSRSRLVKAVAILGALRRSPHVHTSSVRWTPHRKSALPSYDRISIIPSRCPLEGSFLHVIAADPIERLLCSPAADPIEERRRQLARVGVLRKVSVVNVLVMPSW